MINASELKKGLAVRFDGEIYVVTDYELVKPGKGPAYLQTKLKHLKNGNVIDKRLNTADKVEDIFIERNHMEYLYDDGSNLVFMDINTYEQHYISKDLVEGAEHFLQPNMRVQVSFIEGQAIGVELPPAVELKIVETAPPLKGATVTNKTKPAILETGYRVMVPPFVEQGTVIRVDTRTGLYLERAR
ncbi:MAG: elongation factor P [Planctomycetota bacterium]